MVHSGARDTTNFTMPPDDGSSLFNSAQNRRKNSPSNRHRNRNTDDEPGEVKPLGVVEYAPYPFMNLCMTRSTKASSRISFQNSHRSTSGSRTITIDLRGAVFLSDALGLRRGG
jgi:hypothetical protein